MQTVRSSDVQTSREEFSWKALAELLDLHQGFLQPAWLRFRLQQPRLTCPVTFAGPGASDPSSEPSDPEPPRRNRLRPPWMGLPSCSST